MSRTFGVGIVGAGTIGRVHAAELAGIEAAELVAIAEPHEGAGRELAGVYGAEWHPDLEGLLARDDVDVVVLCTPSGLHPDGAEAAARAGKHVITEKPMAITLDGVDRMIGACREAGVTLSVIFQYRFNRDALRMKRALDAGLFGRPVLCNALVHWQRTQAYYDEKGGWRGTWKLDGGGALMNQSVHAVDLLQWLLGPVESLCAYTETLTHDIETEDLATAALRFHSGAMGVIQGTTCAHRDYPLKVELQGTEGGATFEGTRLTGWYPNRDQEVLSEEELALFPDSGDEPFGAAHGRQLREIFDALREGREPPVPGEEARKAVEIILGTYRAARSGERASFPLRTVEAS
ncbi:MAG: Gfo/Idh/MocA family oxidoreductase [Actinomycetota bacterium]|nr:Gfo/Idh/MocA family oxidoreductase [Actinomycetota bacterium]